MEVVENVLVRYRGCELALRTDGIHVFRVQGVRHVDLEWARGLIAVLVQADVQRRPTLAYLEGLRYVDADARRYFGSDASSVAMANRVALVAQNPITRMIGNFFIGLSRPAYPSRVFGSEADAVTWLRAAVD